MCLSIFHSKSCPFVRDALGFGLFFSIYESILFGKREGDSWDPLLIVIAGGTAGLCYSLVHSVFEGAELLLKKQSKVGRRHWTRLFGRGMVTGIKALPANALGFLAYEYAMQYHPHVETESTER